MKKNTAISMIIGTVISLIALYFAFRNIPFRELAVYLISINYFWVIPSTIVALSTFLLRAKRWQIILGTSHDISCMDSFHPLMIGFMLNCILPARMGELARPAILMKQNRVPFTFGIATVAAERVFDLVLLISLFAVVLSTVQIDPGLSIPFGKYHLNKETLDTIFSGMVKLCVMLITAIILMSFDKIRALINRCIAKVPSLFFFLSPGNQKKIETFIVLPMTRIINNIAAGFSLIKSPKKMFMCLGLSFLIWILSVLAYYLIAMGCPGIRLSFYETAVYMIIICFFIALPSVPGYWGLWEAGGIFALTLFNVPAKEAAGYTLTAHAFQIFPVVLVGIISAMIIGINIRHIQKIKTEA